MQPGRGSSIAVLDDSSLLEILSRVGAANARDLANCLCVSMRWRELGCAVPRLTFCFSKVENSDQLQKSESFIASILRHVKQAAPGCLKALKVTLGIVTEESEDPPIIWAEWLVYADSVVDLELDLQVLRYGDEPQWEPDVCTLLSSFHALKHFKLRGSLSFHPRADETPFKNLTSFHMLESYADPEMLRDLCAACPLLKDLRVIAFMDETEFVEIASASLERFEVDCGMPGMVPMFHLCTPRLASLRIGGVSRDGVELSFSSLESLSHLRLEGSCEVCSKKQCDGVTQLYLDGTWELRALASVLQRTPMVTDATMGSSLQVMDLKIPIGQVFSPLANLETINFHSLEPFEADDTQLVCETVTVHVKLISFGSEAPSEAPPVLKQLLDVYRVKKMVVHRCELLLKFLPVWQAVIDAFPPGRLKI